MDFAIPSEQQAMLEEIRRFGENEIEPVAGEYDRDETYPHEIMDKAAEMGLLGSAFPVEYGGADYSMLERALMIEELFSIDPGIALCITSADFGSEAILEFGTEEQKERYLPPIAAGEAVMGAAISEPQAGSDVTSLTTRAEKSGDEWVINGNKMWITNGTIGDYFVVLCETDPDAESRHAGYSQLIVEADRDGFDADKISGKMGVRASPTAELILDDVRVPEANLVGTRGEGFYQQMQFFDETRVTVAAQGVGIATGAADRAREYAQEREQFDQAIAEFQAIQHKIAEMYTDIEAARQLTYKAAWAADRDDVDGTRYSSMAKEYGSRVAVDVANEAVQIHGGSGYVDDFAVERFYRDAKITQIYEGTTEVQKNIIARELLS
ncbi:acyl-CoA dehydrogenase family protein [Natronolimnohabitans innermongolicus]|uniref:Acyl-CoA dehydrogenase n=1 Tax=Natronolimnohabitans innermongolicus JCM 12255 TaxID=1227499 RepID=L9WMJ8_9EURY|nr:acyl-CoA dehydrogenase family protein [Natronolimnohabitans innermongolicus]ELY50446.1 acyl-CoA dehydrogenase [Natronolimnohabitans innermongolicus JCM 12255]